MSYLGPDGTARDLQRRRRRRNVNRGLIVTTIAAMLTMVAVFVAWHAFH